MISLLRVLPLGMAFMFGHWLRHATWWIMMLLLADVGLMCRLRFSGSLLSLSTDIVHLWRMLWIPRPRRSCLDEPGGRSCLLGVLRVRFLRTRLAMGRSDTRTWLIVMLRLGVRLKWLDLRSFTGRGLVCMMGNGVGRIVLCVCRCMMLILNAMRLRLRVMLT